VRGPVTSSSARRVPPRAPPPPSGSSESGCLNIVLSDFRGGALYADTSLTLRVTRCNFTSNRVHVTLLAPAMTTLVFGGALVSYGNNVVIQASVFSRNTVTGARWDDVGSMNVGGGAFAGQQGSFRVFNSTFVGNWARQHGGTTLRGGAVFLSQQQGKVNIQGCGFRSNFVHGSGNVTSVQGGAVYSTSPTNGGELQIIRSSFTGNVGISATATSTLAYLEGGAVYGNSASVARIIGCNFTGNGLVGSLRRATASFGSCSGGAYFSHAATAPFCRGADSSTTRSM
jgi:hypothetical protein